MSTCAYANGVYLGLKRGIPSVQTDLLALTTTQQSNIWTALQVVAPVSDGPQGGLIALITAMVTNVLVAILTLNGASNLKMLAAACYVRDFPQWLMMPTFDTSINVPGYTLTSSSSSAASMVAEPKKSGLQLFGEILAAELNRSNLPVGDQGDD